MPTAIRSRTFSPRPRDIERRWYVVDADGAVLGRLASEVAKILRGKHKPIFAPHMDTGDHVIVVNARGVRLTAGKESSKLMVRHSGYPGGLRTMDYGRLMAERPTVAVERAVRGMLPKTRLGRQMLKKLAVYEGPEHPHQAQKPAALGVGEIPRWEGLPQPAPRPEPKPKVKPEKGTPRQAKADRASSPARSSRPGATAKAGTSRTGRLVRRRGGTTEQEKPAGKPESEKKQGSGRRRSRATGTSEES